MATSDARLLMSGERATQTAIQVLRTARPARISGDAGISQLVPGTIWGEGKMLVTPDNGNGAVVFLDGSDLWEQDRATFIRVEYLNALGRGASHAVVMIELAKVEIEFLQGVFVPGGIAFAGTCAKVGAFYVRNRGKFEPVIAQTKTLGGIFGEFKHRYPLLYGKLKSTVWGPKTALILVKGISTEDVVFFLGRIIRGYFFDGTYLPKLRVPRGTQLPLDLAWMSARKVLGPRKVLAWAAKQSNHLLNLYGSSGHPDTIISIILSCFGLVALLHSPGLASRGAKAAMTEMKRGGNIVTTVANGEWNVQLQFGYMGVDLSSTELDAIKSEVRSYKDTREFLTEAVIELVTFDEIFAPLLKDWSEMTG
jgi:hypothetical protein